MSLIFCPATSSVFSYTHECLYYILNRKKKCCKGPLRKTFGIYRFSLLLNTKQWNITKCVHRRERSSWFNKNKEVKSLSRIWLFVTPWTVAYHAPPSMGFSRQEYWSGLPFPLPEDLPDPGIEPGSPTCRQMLYHLSHQGSPKTKETALNQHVSNKTDNWLHNTMLNNIQCVCAS